jgi:hypothetical protein
VWENDTLDAGDVGAIPTTEKGVANGVASLGADGYVPEDETYPYQSIGAIFKGSWFRPPFYTRTMTQGGSTARAHFIYINSTIDIDRIGVSIGTAGSLNGSARFGIYGPYDDLDISDAVGAPIVVDSGEIVIDTTGLIANTVDATLQRGWYCILEYFNNATPTNYTFSGYEIGIAPGIYGAPYLPGMFISVASANVTQQLYSAGTTASASVAMPLQMVTVDLSAQSGTNVRGMMVIIRRKIT